MKIAFKLLGYFLFSILLLQCKEDKTRYKNTSEEIEGNTSGEDIKLLKEKPEEVAIPHGMVWIPGGAFSKGAMAKDKNAMRDEKPSHAVAVDGFFMDVTEVTNAQFKSFVEATGYETIAERAIEWEEMKKQLPAGTSKPHDSILQPGSLTFKKMNRSIENLQDFSQWWNWTIGANWKHPNGPESTIEGKDDEPVVHIAYQDAQAYCEWSGRRLPTEAEWELAAKGNRNAIYFWGDDDTKLSEMANTWEGEFPVTNTKIDGFEARAPVKSFAPNDFGLYDIAGNVWEWTSDWYNTSYYQEASKANQVMINPEGPERPYNRDKPYAIEKVIKGGSFLCNPSYCASYRISARMATSIDSSLEHLGFRTVATVAMLEKPKKK